jgi:Restriction endonuclease
MVTPAQREAIRRAYRFQCGYCSVHENDVGSALEIDHFQPLSSGGTDEESNLVYACSACNKAKGDFWPLPNTETRLLHPKRDALDEHMRLSPDDHLQPLTPTGAFHIRRLRLNRPQLVALRQAHRRATHNRARLTELETQIVEFRREIVSLEGQLAILLEQIRRLIGQDT